MLAGVRAGSEGLLFCGLAAYWAGDVADGLLARGTGAETRTGAVFDVLCDRLCVAVFYLAYVQQHLDMLIPIGIFLVSFMLVDNMLSLGFLGWPLLGPNYFYLVDKRLYRLNWSPPAKAANTALILVVIVGTGSWVAATVVALGQLGLKLYSTALLARLQPGYADGCARPGSGGSPS